MTRKNVFVLLIGVLICLALVSSPTMAAEKTFKIGLCTAFSGGAAPWGIAFANGAKMVGEYINAKGGLNIGGEKYRIEFAEADSKATSEGAAVAARRLVEAEKVDMVVGPIFSQTSMAAQSVTEPAKVILLCCGSADDVLKRDAGKYGKRHSFRGYISYGEVFPNCMNYLIKKYPEKRPYKIALLSQNYESSWFGHGIVKAYAKIAPVEIVYEELYDEGTKDFYPFLVKMVSKNPDVLYNTSDAAPEWALKIKQARELGYKGRFMEQAPPDVAVMLPIAGKENLEGELGLDYLTEGPMASAGAKEFRAKYTKKYGRWDGSSLMTAGPVHIILQAYEQAGALDSGKVVEILETGKVWDNISGIPGTFGGTARYGQPHQYMCQQWIHEIRDGKSVPLEDGEVTVEAMVHAWD
jgi:branched-chain amino acid transport system substrate-binding protein